MKKILSLTIAMILIFSSAGEVFATSDFPTCSVELTSTKRLSNSLSAQWEPLNDAGSYEMQCSTNRFFTDPFTAEVGAGTSEYTFTGLSDQEQYYFRIRAHRENSSGETDYTVWTHSENTTAIGQPQIKQLSFGSKVFEIRGGASQSVGYYDTLQGGCSDGDFGYFTLYNRKKEKCKIAKFDLATGKKIKVSKILSISHGNDLAYNSEQNVIAAVHSTNNGKQVTLINPKTLKIIRHEYITLDSPVPGMTEKRRAAFKGIGAIAYNEQFNQYVARVKSTNDLLFLDENFNPIRYKYLSTKDKQLYQGMDTCGDYVLIGQSPKGSKPYNIISVYDWNGNYVSKVNIKKGYELECLFHTEDAFYAGFYRSYYKTYYASTFKVVIKKGEKVRIETKTKKKKLMRDNYIYKMSRL